MYLIKKMCTWNLFEAHTFIVVRNGIGNRPEFKFWKVRRDSISYDDDSSAKAASTRKEVNFAISLNPKVKIKVNNDLQMDKYPDLTSLLKKLLSMKVTVIPVVIRDLGTIFLKKTWKRDLMNWRLTEKSKPSRSQ